MLRLQRPISTRAEEPFTGMETLFSPCRISTDFAVSFQFTSTPVAEQTFSGEQVDAVPP